MKATVRDGWRRERNDIRRKLLKYMGHVYKREWQRKKSRAEIRKKKY